MLAVVLPGPQFKQVYQSVAPVLLEYLPSGQAVQSELPVPEYLPAPQSVQAELLVLPVFALYLPAAQAVQATLVVRVVVHPG